MTLTWVHAAPFRPGMQGVRNCSAILSDLFESFLLVDSKRVGNRERGLQSQQRETKKERDAWGSFSKDEVSEG